MFRNFSNFLENKKGVAPLVIAAGLAAIFIAGALAGTYATYVFKVKPLQELIGQTDAETAANILVSIKGDYANLRNYQSLAQDWSKFSESYFWMIGKYAYIKARENGSSMSDSMLAATKKINEVCTNFVKSLVLQHNAVVRAVNLRAIQYNKLDSAARTSTGSCVCSFSGQNPDGVQNETLTAIGQRWNVSWFWVGTSPPSLVLMCTQGGALCSKEVYFGSDALTTTENIINNINSEYNRIIDNLGLYFNALETQGYNLSDVVDAYMLANLFNTKANTTGYPGWAAANLAVDGFPTIGINKTVCIRLDTGQTICGWMFSDWYNQTFERGKTYTLPTNGIMYLIDENGNLIRVLPGTNFTVTDLRTINGTPINSTKVVRYVVHTGDVSKLYDEFKKLLDLYEQTLHFPQASTSSQSLLDWWNNLPIEYKVAIVGGAAFIILVLLFRRS